MSTIDATDMGLDIGVAADDLVADYVPDASGRYRVYLADAPGFGTYMVTRLGDGDDERYAHRLDRDPSFDWTEAERKEWMLDERFGSCPDFGPDDADGVCWIDGAAYVMTWADDVVHIGLPVDEPTDTSGVKLSGFADPAQLVPFAAQMVTMYEATDVLTDNLREAAGNLARSLRAFGRDDADEVADRLEKFCC